jgi:hypothetical protein
MMSRPVRRRATSLVTSYKNCNVNANHVKSPKGRRARVEDTRGHARRLADAGGRGFARCVDPRRTRNCRAVGQGRTDMQRGRTDMQRAGQVERRCNAQVPDDRNLLEIQALKLRAQTIRSEGARFALRVLFATRGP